MPKNKNKQPWPTKMAMEQVYEMNLWGGEGQFYSGEGSHKEEIVKPYLHAVIEFFKTLEEKPTVLDLGCGDFNIGSQLIEHTKYYTAVDIVEPLIKRNRRDFKAPNLSFECLDIAKNNLPKADCVIIRQVLQHLSNQEVKQVIEKLKNYKYLVLTEHLPNGRFEPNKDIISGQGIRLKKNSGLDLLVEPFNLKLKEVKELVYFDLGDKKGRIVTSLFVM